MNFAKDDLNGKSVADRFGELDARRRAKLDRARTCSTLTLPSVLSPVLCFCNGERSGT